MERYQIHESVGASRQRVRSYDDLEIHHPSHRGREPGRSYAEVEGEREEVLRTRTLEGNLMVSKDFILSDLDSGSASVRVPSPVAGYIGRVDARQGLVEIYDRPGGELLAKVRHMDLRGSGLEAGDTIGYGEPMGTQSGFGGGNPRRYGVHVHVDINENYLPTFEQYISDLDAGVITTTTRPEHAPQAASRRAGADGLLQNGEAGIEVRHLQEALDRLGYRDARGNRLKADGDFGDRTQQAVESFQRSRGLALLDGEVGRDTLSALVEAARDARISDPLHPAHRLYESALERIRELPSGTFANETQQRNAAANLAIEAGSSGFRGIDHVVLGTDGRNLFAIQGGLDDPAKLRVHLERHDAAADPADASVDRLLRQMQEAQREQQQVEQRRVGPTL